MTSDLVKVVPQHNGKEITSFRIDYMRLHKSPGEDCRLFRAAFCECQSKDDALFFAEAVGKSHKIDIMYIPALLTTASEEL